MTMSGAGLYFIVLGVVFVVCWALYGPKRK